MPSHTQSIEVPGDAAALALARFQELRRRVDEEPNSPEPAEAEWITDLLEVAAPSIRNQELQRLKEALEGLDRYVVGTGSSGGHYEEHTVGQMILMNEENARGEKGQWIKRVDAFAALGTLDPSGEGDGDGNWYFDAPPEDEEECCPTCGGAKQRVVREGHDPVMRPCPDCSDPSGEGDSTEKLRAERQHWLDEDVKNTAEIERLEDRQDALERALLPFIDAKPMPGAEDDHYRLHISGEALRAAKSAYHGPAVPPSGEQGEEKHGLPPQRNAKGGLTTFGLYVRSLRWAVDYIDKLKPKRFRSDERPLSDDGDWMEWAAAYDLLKDASAVSATDPSKEVGNDGE